VIERNHSPLVDVTLCQEEPSLLIARHTDGCLSLWKVRENTFNYDFLFMTEHGKFSRREQSSGDIISFVSAPNLKPFRVVIVSPLGQVQLLQVKQKKRDYFLVVDSVKSFLGKLTCFSVSPDAKLPGRESLVVVGNSSGSLQIVDANNWTTKKLVMIDHKQPIKDLCWIDNDFILFWSSIE
jgi:hypothetical protein